MKIKLQKIQAYKKRLKTKKVNKYNISLFTYYIDKKKKRKKN